MDSQLLKLKDFLNYLTEQALDYQILMPEKMDIVINGPENIQESKLSNCAFLKPKQLSQTTSNLKAGLLFTTYETELSASSIIVCRVNCKEPKLDFVNFIRYFFMEQREKTVSSTAIIAKSASLGLNISVGDYSIIEDGAIIGDNTKVGNHVNIKANCIIGENVRIDDGAIIGGDGFGYVKTNDGDYLHFPHFGNVIIKDNVYVGKNTCIDRGSLSDTIIEKGVKIDNLVHIAHNVKIQENSLIIAHAVIAGSSKIEKNCWIAPGAVIRNNIIIGENCVVGMGSIVTRDIESNKTVLGNPAKEH